VTMIDVNDVPTLAIGIDTQAKLILTFTSGGFFTPGEPGAIISKDLAAQGGYAVGDILTLSSGQSSIQAPVTGIFNIPPQLIQPGQSTSAIALYWEDLAKLQGVPLEGEPTPTGLQVILTPPHPTADQVDDAISAINDVLLANGINANYVNWIRSTDAITQLIQTAGIVLNTAAALIAAVGAIGLLSVLSMSVFERQKEIGVMRSVGATSGAVAFQFLVEGLIVSVIAWLLGIPLSYALDHNLIVQFNVEHAAGVQYPPVALVLGLGSMLIIGTVASLWPSITAARKTVSDILRYQ
jgi:ABC-type lipoprotein release transport system permease subunit